jgi:hypothetical protein
MTRCALCNQLVSDAPVSRRQAGGLAVLNKYGADHFKAIGAKGGRPRKPVYSRKDASQAPVSVGISQATSAPVSLDAVSTGAVAVPATRGGRNQAARHGHEKGTAQTAPTQTDR